MQIETIFVIGMFLTFGSLLFSGFPVAWVLAGTAVIWTMIGIVGVEFFGVDLWFDWGSSLTFWPMWMAMGLLRVATLFPYPAQLMMGRVLGKLIRYLSRKRNQIVEINLRYCFPEMSQTERDRIRDDCYANFGISLFEMAMCWWWPDQRLKPLVEIRGKEHIDAVLQSGKGAILLTGHYASLEIGGRLLSLYMPIQVMYRTQKNRLFDSYLYTRRNSYFVDTISRKKTRSLIKGIKNGIPTWYAPDQNFPNEKNVFADFMGVKTATITASSRLAQSSGGAMLPYYPERKNDGSGYILWIEPPLENFPSGDDLKDATAINASIEKIVRKHPGHYMWIHKRFKTRPPGEPPIYP